MNFLRQPTIIPAEVLSTGDGQSGMKAEYFPAENFAQAPQVVRVDKQVDLEFFHPDQSAIVPPSGMKDFSVRWEGFLTPAESGTYQIGLVGSMNQLWIDDRLVVDDLHLHDPTPTTKTLQLEKGRRYALKIEFVRGGFGTKLVWLNVVSDPIGEAVAAAKQADVAVAVLGITSQLEGEEIKVDVPGFKGGDRTSLA